MDKFLLKNSENHGFWKTDPPLEAQKQVSRFFGPEPRLILSVQVFLCPNSWDRKNIMGFQKKMSKIFLAEI